MLTTYTIAITVAGSAAGGVVITCGILAYQDFKRTRQIRGRLLKNIVEVDAKGNAVRTVQDYSSKRIPDDLAGRGGA
jgi:hypothetical protein